METLVDQAAGYQEPVHMAMGPTHVYWINRQDGDAVPSGGVYRVDKSTGVNELFHALTAARRVAADDQCAYFIGGDPCASYRKPHGSGATDAAEGVVQPASGCMGTIAVDDTHLFWTIPNLDGPGLLVLGTAKEPAL